MAKNKIQYKEEKQDYKAYFEGETGIFIIENLTRDIIERCKLPEAIELRKLFGYNHDNIMVREKTSVAEKIIIFFLTKILCLKNNFKIFRCNPNDPEFDINKFLGEINFYVTKLCK